MFTALLTGGRSDKGPAIFSGDNMSKPLQWVLGISILVVAITVAGVGYCASWALQQWGEAAPNSKATLDKLNSALDTINAPCSNGHPCGTLANLDKTTVKIGDAIVQTQLVERATTPHVTAAMDTFNTAAQKLGGAADNLSGTATALTGTANAATATLDEGQRTVAAAQPLLAAYTRSGDDLDSLIRDNAAPLHTTLVHAAGMSASGDLMLADAQWKTHQLLHPDKVKLGFWGATWAGIKAIHSIEPPIL